MNECKMMSDWVTQEEFDSHPTGELAEVVELARSRSRIIRMGLAGKWQPETEKDKADAIAFVKAWPVRNSEIMEWLGVFA